MYVEARQQLAFKKVWVHMVFAREQIVKIFKEFRVKLMFAMLVAKKEFACNGTVVDHSEYGEVLQLQGDQRENICKLLVNCGLVKQDQLKVHGF